jgi:hypothetical protein
VELAQELDNKTGFFWLEQKLKKPQKTTLKTHIQVIVELTPF